MDNGEIPRHGPVAVVFNPHARRNHAYGRSLQRLREIVGDDGHLHVTQLPGDLDRVAGRIREEGVGLLAISGGDGTYHKVLTAVIEAFGDAPLPVILPLRGGTFNALARHVTPRGDAERILARGLAQWKEARAAGRPVPLHHRPILRIENTSRGCVHYGFLCAHGLVARIVARYNEGPKSAARGAGIIGEALAAYVTGAEKELFERYEARVFVNGEPVGYDRILTVFSGTLDHTVMGMSPFASRFPPRRSFKYLLVAMDVSEFFGMTPALFRGRKWNTDPRLVNDRAREIVVESAEGYMIDGDLWPSGVHRALRVTLGPLLKFLQLPAT